MDTQSKPDPTTGSLTSKTQIPENAGDNTEARSTPAQARSESASINVVQLLSLLQTDCFDLQSKGLRLVLSGTMTGRLGILVDWPGHKLDFVDGKIVIDGKAV